MEHKKIARLPEVNELFKALNCEKALLAGAPGRLPNLLWCNYFRGESNNRAV